MWVEAYIVDFADARLYGRVLTDDTNSKLFLSNIVLYA
jgi:hypothetical protein